MPRAVTFTSNGTHDNANFARSKFAQIKLLVVYKNECPTLISSNAVLLHTLTNDGDCLQTSPAYWLNQQSECFIPLYVIRTVARLPRSVPILENVYC